MRSLYGVLNNFGSLLLRFALLFAVPALVAGANHELGALRGFVAGGLVAAILGLVLRTTTARFRHDLRPRDAFLLVCTSLLALAAVASVPFAMDVPRLGFTRAYFEAMSDLSTTGATMLRGLDTLPRSVNLWRALLSWCGGLGAIVFAVAVLPLLGIGGMQLFRSGAPGAVKNSTLVPRILASLHSLWPLYAVLTAACALALWVVGMPAFDALCHALSALSLGGVSTHDQNVAFFHSAGIDLVLMLFLVIAATNFTTHAVALQKGELGIYPRDRESRWTVVVLLGGALFVAAYLWARGTYEDFFTALHHAAFNVISIGSGGGFFTVPFGSWPIFAPLWMLFLSCVCAANASAGGGVKMFRSMILAKQSLREMFQLVHPQAVKPLQVSGRVIPDDVAYSVLAFIFLYFLTVVALTFAMLISGLDFVSSLSAVVACINNVGPGLNLVAPGQGYAALTDFQSWVCVAAMFLGRVEIITAAVLVLPTFWRK